MTKRKVKWVATALALLSSLQGCKVSDDAIAASQQLNATAYSLHEYYAALCGIVEDTVSLYEIDAALSGTPYGDADRAQQQTTLDELKKREELADALGRLAASFTKLTKVKAASDTEKAGTALGNELIDVKALPSGSPVPDALGQAGNLLLQAVQQHEEKKAARAMDAALSAVRDLFEKEKPTYDSLARNRVRQAAEMAKAMLGNNTADATPMLGQVLEPFHLAPLPADAAVQAKLKALALLRLQRAQQAAIDREAAASSAMLDALNEMVTRVHQVAEEKPMPLRSAPFSLQQVEAWAQSWSASLV